MIVEYLNFIGLGLYVLSSLMFLFLFLRTLRTKDGIGLLFLRALTLSLFIGSFTVAFTRYMVMYNFMSADMGRGLAIINPITLLAVGLYLNYLFHRPEHVMNSKDSQNIKDIKQDVKTVKQDVKEVKKNIV